MLFTGSLTFQEKFFQYGKYPTSHDIVKALAITSMVIDHIGLFIMGDDTWFRTLGRLAGPLFFFAVGHSLNTTLTWRLFCWGLFLSLLSYSVFGSIYLNILLSFLVVRMIFTRWQPEETSRWLLVAIFIVLLLLGFFRNFIIEYGPIGIAFAVGGRLVRTGSQEKKWWMICTVLFHFVWAGIHFEAFEQLGKTLLLALESVVLLSLVDFKRGELQLPKGVGYPIMALSRFSLDIYVYHLSALLLFALAFMS